MTQQILTIGHSNYSFEVFLNLIKSHNVESIVDVRRFPSSKKFPHFNKENLEASLTNEGIRYFHLSELGGRRNPLPDSENTGLINNSFRGFADYMNSEDFETGIQKLLTITSRYTTAIMCSEALWWSCHRSLIADFLKCEGYPVKHIMNKGKEYDHHFTSAAKCTNGKLSYPPEENSLFN